jgi:hypothetical protein
MSIYYLLRNRWKYWVCKKTGRRPFDRLRTGRREQGGGRV